MKNMQLSIDKALDFVSKSDIDAYSKAVAQASVALEDGTGKGNDFLGWLHLPSSITEEMIQDIEETARQLRSTCDAVVVAGIGGSYLGAKAVIEALSDSFSWLKKGDSPVILFAGNNISEDYLAELTELLRNRRFGIINISKSWYNDRDCTYLPSVEDPT